MKTNKFLNKVSIVFTGLLLMSASVVNATTYYSYGNRDATNRNYWWTGTNGTGLHPAAFTNSADVFIVQSGHIYTAAASWTVAGSVQISGTLKITVAGTVKFGGSVTVASVGTLQQNNNYDNASTILEIDGDLSIAGTYNYTGYSPAVWMNGSGTHYINTGSTSLCKLLFRTGNFYANGTVTVNEDFYAMWNQVGGSFHTNGQIVNANWGVVVSGGTFYVDGGTLTVGSTVGGMLIGRTSTLDGDLQVSSGTINISGGGIYLGTSGATPKGTCTLSGGNINVAILDLGQNSTFTQSGGTNTINGSLNLNYSSSTYKQTATSALSIAGNFLNNGVYNTTGAGIASLNINGSLTNNGTFTTTSTSTVTFDRSGNSEINGSASTTFYNLVLNKSSSGITLTNNSSAKAFSVSNDLTVTTGNLILAATDNNYNFEKNVTVSPNATLTHSVDWDAAGKNISIGGNLEVTGIFNPTVRSHVQLNGLGPHTIQTGTNPASTLSILTMNNGDFTASGPLKTNQEAWIMFGANGTFTTNGKDVTFGSLVMNKGTFNVTIGGTLTVNGSTQVDYGSGAAMNISAGTVNLNGSLTIGSLGSITCSNAPQINITGNWTNSGAFTPAGSTVTFKGTGNQQIGGTTSNNFNNLIINPSAGVTVSSVSNNIVMNGNLTVSTGIFDLTTFTCNRTTLGGIFSLASGTLLKAAGANNFPQSFSTNTLNVNSTVEYYGTIAQSVSPVTYGSLTVSNNSTKTATGVVNIAGNLNINSSAVFAGATYAHTIAGNWYNNVSASGYSAGTSTFTFNGSSAQTIGGTAPTTFNKLTLNNASGVSISQDQTVNSTLTLTAGRLNVGTKIFTFGPSAPAVAGTFSASTMIVADGGGEVRKNYSATGSWFFPVGDITGTAEYSPITLNYTSGSFAAGAYSGVKVTNARSPYNTSSTDFLKRYWTISNSGITAPSFTANAKYVAADIAGTESNISSAKYAGTATWVRYGIISSNTVTTTSINNTGTGIIISGITNQLPTVSISSTGYCAGGSVVLNPVITNGTSSMTYAWSPATGLSSTTIANPTATPLSSTTYTLTVTDGNGFTKSASVTLSQYPSGSWAGVVSSDWDDAANWVCGPIPTSAIDVTIPSGLSFYPVINAGTDYARNITIQSGASLTVAGGKLKISGTVSNSGTLNAASGTIEMNGASAQSISGSMFLNKTIQNLIVSNTGSGLSISSISNDTLKITGAITFGSATTTLNTGDNITLVSNSLGTARIGTVGIGNTITGKVIVERYINTGTGAGQHGKSWQFLSAPTYGQTIKESWMENGNIPGNYGTTISGPAGTAAGFDMYSVAPSMKYFDPSTGNWKGVSSANDIISNTGGYMVFIRGDRTVTGTSQPANTTVLRTKGTLFTGNQLPIIVKANSFQSVGNPYASPIDFALITKDANVDNAFYVYDPYLYGTYGVGGYQTLSTVNNWKPVPGGTSAYPVNVLSSVIQSGQAFFVHSNSSNDGSLTIAEGSKSATGRPGHSNREATGTTNEDRQFLRASLVTSAGLMADGNVAAFDNSFRNAIDGNDVVKLTNSGENFGIKSAGKILSIEAKSQVSAGDTIFYNLTNLSKTAYKLIFVPENMEATGLQGILTDKYLATETAVSLSDSTIIEVAVTSNAGSSAADRFKIVFRQMGTLPVSITSVTAINKNADNIISWTVANENGIKQYEVEKSADAVHFSQVAIAQAANQPKGNYTAIDQNAATGIHYYRIKIVSMDGKANYSSVVKVSNESKAAAITVYPNPITGNVIHLQLHNQATGKYQIKLYNAGGQVLLSKGIQHAEGSSSENIKCDNLPKGVYQLMINTPAGKTENIQVIK